jgi:urea transporter
MLKEKWSRLVETNAPCDFIDTLLRGFGQIIFCNNPLVGLIVLIGFLDSPTSGILALISSISAITTAILMRTEHSLIKSGLFGCSGALIGFALSIYVPLNLLLIPLLVLAGILSAILTKILINTLSIKFNLPVLSVPFVLVTWAGLLSLRYIPSAPIMHNLPKFLIGGQIEQVILPALSAPLSTIFHALSAIFFQHSVLLGMFCLLGILIYSRISTIFGLAGGAIGILLFGILTTSGGNYAKELTIGFNCALIGIALGGFFITLTWQATLYALFAVITGAVTSLALINLLGIFDVPALASPFNLVTLLFLCILRMVPTTSSKAGLELVPLVQINRPEANLNWYPMANLRRINQQVRLSLPFYGTWYVSYGNNRQPTHQGTFAYAWDFVVLDEHKKLCRVTGTDNDDYYAFGLPVLAPAPGTVVKVVSSIRDNTPLNANWEQNWGNYVIIDHGNNEFSEISHFRQHSIVVKEGEGVVRGQLMGTCGNSGLSISPHIHYQLQNAGTIGADTVPARFHNYTINKGSTKVAVKEGIPKEGKFVSNSLLASPVYR